MIVCLLLSLSAQTMAGIYRDDVPAALYKAYANQPQFECTGEVFEKTTQHGGSCVLIGKKYVLSAAHVFIRGASVPDTQMVIDGNKVTTYKQINKHVGDARDFEFRFRKRRYGAKRIVIMPAYLDKATKGMCDVALIELEDEVEGVTPAVLNKEYNELHSLVTGVGFGASGRAGHPEEVDLYNDMIAGQNVIDTFGDKVWNGHPVILTADFDRPFHKECNKTGDATPVLLEYAVGGGDSGGPLFRQTKDGWELVGICSGSVLTLDDFMKTGYYGQCSEWIRVSVLYDWIQKTIRDMEQSK